MDETIFYTPTLRKGGGFMLFKKILLAIRDLQHLLSAK